MKAIIKLVLGTISVLIADLLLRGVSLGDMETLHGVLTAVLTAAVLALLNSFLKPILVLLTLPITLLSLGLFLLVINAALVMLADSLIPGFTLEAPRFWWALGFSLVVSIVQGLLQGFDRKQEKGGA